MDSSEPRVKLRALCELAVSNGVLQNRVKLHPRCRALCFPIAAAGALPQQALTGETALLALIPRCCTRQFRQCAANFLQCLVMRLRVDLRQLMQVNELRKRGFLEYVFLDARVDDRNATNVI